MAKEKVDLSKITFEELMSQLDAILKKMENSQLALEDLLKNYESGAALAKECRSRLLHFEKRIQLLAQDDGAQGQWQDFNPDQADGARTRKPDAKSPDTPSELPF